MQQDQGIASTNPRPKHPQKRASLRVYLVEDLPVVRNRIVESLEEIDGLEVAGFADGEESAVSWLRSNHCDVLILDLELRQGNGLGVLKALAAGSGPGPVKIVYSNHASSNICKVAIQLGATYFFDKTMDTPKLRLLLEDLAAAAG